MAEGNDRPEESEEPDNTDNLIARYVESLDPGAVLTKFVVIAEGIDPQGERAVYTSTHDDANSWDVIGLVKYILIREEAALIRSAIQSDDEDDDSEE